MGKPKLTAAAMQRYRDRMRAQGLRPVQMWVPDTRSPAFIESLRRQALLVARKEGKPSPARHAIDVFLEQQDDSGWTA
jgi:hypothetical protein